TSFTHSLTVTFTYGSSDVSGLDESTLAIYRNDSGTWTKLSNCTVDTTAKTITCTTDNFSTFSIFGAAVTVNTTPAPTVVVSNGSPIGPLSYGYQNISQSNGVNGKSGNKTGFQFTRSLKVGSVGEDVRQLQIFLNTHGFIVST